MCRDAIDVIQRFDHPDAVIYCDPPYVMATRKGTRDYKHEIDDVYHERLASVLKACKGRVMLSGYASDLYQRLYGTWRTDSRVQALTASRDKSQKRTETLWMNW